MNQDQLLSLVRSLVTIGATVLVSDGVIQAADLNTDVGIIMAAVGSLGAAGSLVWGIWSKTHANSIAKVAALPNVTKIVTDPVTASSIPSTKVVSS